MPPPDPRFLESLPYRPEAFLIDEVLDVDVPARRIRARLRTTKPMPLLDLLRASPIHPTHIPGGLLVHLTGMLGCLHAHLLHGVRFDEGWIGYGARIHRAEFRKLVRVGPDLDLDCVETRARLSPDRQIVRYEFRFTQEGDLRYFGEQTAIWLRGAAALALADGEAAGDV